ncbi:MAG: SDR family NAD(P)-dependent oxidoreductase [Dehalococcoidia bacterium]|nr:SDR family NAD(P)-dependent oxidoreductase [Dehalococcoidia bacterium]
MELKDRVAIVTGASRGIGRAIALALARAGANVVVAARTESEGGPLDGTIHQSAEQISRVGSRVLAVRTDVSNDEDVENMVQSTLQEFGRIDILVNNAAALFRAPILDTPIRRWDLMNQVNLRATFVCTRAVLPTMVQQRWGHVINISPPVDLKNIGTGSIAQQVHKMGITIFSAGLAKELAEHNIAVNCLWPEGQRDSEGMRYVYKGVQPDWLSTDVVADAALYIISHDPSEYTGHALTDIQAMNEMGITDLSKYRIEV